MTNEKKTEEKKPKKSTLTKICERYAVSEKAKALINEKMTPQAFSEALREAGLLKDAVEFEAHRLCRRQAVWWAAHSIALALGPEPSEVDAKTLEAVEKWVLEPTEARRRTAEKLAKAKEFATLPAAVGGAVFFAGATMAPDEPNAPLVEPPPHMTPKLILTAITLASKLAVKPEEQTERLKAYLDLARDIDKTEERWVELSKRLASAHARKGGSTNPAKKALIDALKKEAKLLPSQLNDRRLEEENEKVARPRREAAEKMQKENAEKKKAAEEAEKKMKKKWWKKAPADDAPPPGDE